jgi:hypothetical protein
MDVEIACITQRTDSVQLTEPQNHLLSPQHANDPDAGMDLDGDTDPSKHFLIARRPVLGSLDSDVHNVMPKWGQNKDVGAHTQMGGRWSLDENPSGGDDAVLTSSVEHIPPTLINDSHDVFAVFGTAAGPEDDPDDSEWLDSLSVRADTQSIILGDSEDEDDGEIEDDDEMLSGDEAVLAGDT